MSYSTKRPPLPFLLRWEWHIIIYLPQRQHLVPNIPSILAFSSAVTSFPHLLIFGGSRPLRQNYMARILPSYAKTLPLTLPSILLVQNLNFQRWEKKGKHEFMDHVSKVQTNSWCEGDARPPSMNADSLEKCTPGQTPLGQPTMIKINKVILTTVFWRHALCKTTGSKNTVVECPCRCICNVAFTCSLLGPNQS